jgi:oligopeptidase B
MPAPIAKRIPHERSRHGEVVGDDYAWLRDRSDPDAIAYLEAENAHTTEATAHLDGLRRRIFEEIRSRVQETDLSAPARRGPWWYATRTEEGRQYPRFVRMTAPDAPEQIMLDVDELASGHDYLRLGAFAVSPDHRFAAYSVDVDGSEHFTMRIRDLETGADLEDEIRRTYYTAAWSLDGRDLFYLTTDAAHRPDRVWRHRVGTPASADEVIHTEPDERMFLSLSTTQDDRYILISAGSQTTSDVHTIPADDPSASPAAVIERVHGVEYSVDHKQDRWLVATTDGAPDGRLISVAVGDPGDVTELVSARPGRRVNGVVALTGHTVVVGRRDGLTALTILPDDGEPHDLDFPEEVYAVGPGRNLEYDTSVFRIAYQSPVTPPRVIDVDLDTGARTVVKETPVLGGYDPAEYVTERTWAKAADGTRIPISLVSRRDVDRSRPAPLVLYGYGSYEVPIEPTFSVARLSLLDRGVVFAIAHVRGGGEMGRAWYERGKMEWKQNTFTDFVACAEHLVEIGLTEPDRLAARGGSAGGLLIGAVANLRPDLFRVMVADVPFVDVVNTMLDPTLPLTVIEWEEWGNPAEEAAYRRMRAYAPYENVRPVEYPAMLVTAGLNDPRVSYWEPAKWVARMRAEATNRGPLLLKTEMGAGHAGPSGRYDAWRDEAFVLAFVLDQLGSGGGD